MPIEMDIERFHMLSLPQKYYYTSKVGVHLCARQAAEAQIDLYAVHSYYVEIICPLHSSKDSCIRAFSSIDKLEPYLEEIDIECLFQ